MLHPTQISFRPVPEKWWGSFDERMTDRRRTFMVPGKAQRTAGRIRKCLERGRATVKMPHMAVYPVLHHRRDSRQPWANAWLNDDLIEAIQTTTVIGKRCGRAKANDERIFVHRCGWGEYSAIIACSAVVEEVAKIDGSTVLVRFSAAAMVGASQSITPVKGQNCYEV